jgi:uncharacterized protein (TIGR03086 family)
MELTEAHRRMVEWTEPRVGRIRDEQWSLPTPCTEWDVRALLEHMVSGHVWVAPLVAGETIAQVGDRFDGDLLGADPLAAWSAAARQACDAFEQDGALDRIVNLSYGDVPARVYAQERFVDVFCHAWDLSRAIGADERIPEDLVVAAAEALEPFEGPWRASGALGPVLETAPDADAQARLLARLGRRA